MLNSYNTYIKNLNFKFTNAFSIVTIVLKILVRLLNGGNIMPMNKLLREH